MKFTLDSDVVASPWDYIALYKVLQLCRKLITGSGFNILEILYYGHICYTILYSTASFSLGDIVPCIIIITIVIVFHRQQ